MKKERYEWIHSWCDETSNSELPRVLLVGDSITYGYQEQVRELLKGVAYVDYISTSYAIDSPLYDCLIKNFYFDSKYDVLHFNNGIHGAHMNVRTYKTRLAKLLKKLDCQKTIIANSTFCYEKGNAKPNTIMKFLAKRNCAVQEVANELKYQVNDLYSLSKTIPLKKRKDDGFHYTEEGSKIFALQVAEKIKEILR